jgi:hypothetical protein
MFCLPKNQSNLASVALAFWVIISSGCTHVFGPYKYGDFADSSYKRALDENPEPLRGEEHKLMDGLRGALDWPYRVVTRKPKPASYAPTEAQKQTILNYLAENDLEDVQVEFHYFDPSHRWRRLRENKGVAPGWKYSFGVLSLAGYTILPGRVFGSTSYDPYCNCLQVNNNRAYESLEEAAEAKTAHRLRYPGTYLSIVGSIPVVRVYPQLLSSGDIVEYARHRKDWPLEKKAIEGYYVDAALNASSIALIDPSFVDGLAINLVSGAVGEVAAKGRIAVRKVERANGGEEADDDPSKSVYADNDQPNEFSHILFGDRR